MVKREKWGKSKSSAGYNQKMGEDFLQQNAKKEGLFETDSGLQYQVVDLVTANKHNYYSTYKKQKT